MFAKYNSRNISLYLKTLHKNSDEKGRQVSKIFLPRMPFEKKRHLEEYVYVFEVSSENNKTDITSKQAEVDWKARQSKIETSFSYISSYQRRKLELSELVTLSYLGRACFLGR